MTPMAKGQEEIRDWTNKAGKTIKAKFVRGDAKTMTLFVKEKDFIIKLSSLSTESQALARQLTAAGEEADPEGETTRAVTAQNVVATAKAQLSYRGNVKNGKQVMSTRCTVEVELKGSDAKSAYALGPIKAESIRVDGKIVEVEPDRFATDNFKLIDRSGEGIFAKHPKDGVRLKIKYGDISAKPTAIEGIKGSCMVLTGGSKQVVNLSNIMKRPNGPIKDSVLSATGLQLSFKKSEMEDEVELSVTMKVGCIGFAGFKLLDAQGQPIKTTGSGSGQMNDTVHVSVSASKATLKGGTLQILVREGSKKVALPFEVKNVSFK